MGRFLTVRRVEWVPGVAILVVSMALAVLLGNALQLASWPAYGGLVVALVLLFGWLELRRDALRPRRTPRTGRTRSRVGLIEGGRAPKYDLSKDESTNDQKYVM